MAKTVELVETKPEVTILDSTVRNEGNQDTELHTIQDIVSRPVLVADEQWSTNEVGLGFNLTLDDIINATQRYKIAIKLPHDLFTNAQALLGKFDAFKFCKADFKIKVLVNSTPFHQGSLLITYNPLRDYVPDYNKYGCETLQSQSSFPSVILNLEHENSTEMILPYANIFEAFDLATEDFSYGEVYVYVLTPLETGSTDSVNIKVMCQLMNPQLSVPVEKSVSQTPTISTLQMQEMMKKYGIHTALDENGRVIDHTNYSPQGLFTSNEGGESTLPVDSFSGGLRTALGKVPLIGGFANKIKETAESLFGFAKPVELNQPDIYTNQFAKYQCNTTGKDHSYVLAQQPNNAVDPTSMSPTNVDEMSLDYIFDRPYIFQKYSFDKTTDWLDNKLLATIPVTPIPAHLVQDGNLLLGNFSLVSAMFSQWQGALKYSFQFVKTQYHSGRMVAVYYPVGHDIPNTFDSALHTNYLKIMDLQPPQIQDKPVQTFTLEVPYRSNVPWHPTISVQPGGNLITQNNSHHGYIALYAYTDLKAPDTVSQKVQLLVSISQGEGYKVSIPHNMLTTGFSTSSSSDLQIAALNEYGFSVNVGPFTEDQVISGIPQDDVSTSGTNFNFEEHAVEFNDDGADVVYEVTTISMENGVTRYLEDNNLWLSGTAAMFIVYKTTNDRIIYTSANSGSSVQPYEYYSCDGAENEVNRIVTRSYWHTSDNLTADSSNLTVHIIPMPVDAVTTSNAASAINEYVNTYNNASSVHKPSINKILEAIERFLINSEPLPDFAGLPEQSGEITTHNNCLFTVGEETKSLRPLIKRFRIIAKLEVGHIPLILNPWGVVFTANGRMAFRNADGSSTTFNPSWAHLISQLYRFQIGSTRFKIHNCKVDSPQPGNVPIVGRVTTMHNYTYPDIGRKERPDPEIPFNNGGNVEVQVPYYGSTRAQIVGNTNLSSQGKIVSSSVPYFRNASGPLSFAVGDDFSFGYLVGAPPFTYNEYDWQGGSPISS